MRRIENRNGLAREKSNFVFCDETFQVLKRFCVRSRVFLLIRIQTDRSSGVLCVHGLESLLLSINRIK